MIEPHAHKGRSAEASRAHRLARIWWRTPAWNRRRGGGGARRSMLGHQNAHQGGEEAVENQLVGKIRQRWAVKANGGACRGDRMGPSPDRGRPLTNTGRLIEGRSGARTVEGSYATEKLATNSRARCRASIPKTTWIARPRSAWLAFPIGRRRLRHGAQGLRFRLAKEDSFRVASTWAPARGLHRDDHVRSPTRPRVASPALCADDHPQHGSRVGGHELPSSWPQHHVTTHAPPRPTRWRCRSNHPARRCGRDARGSSSISVRGGHLIVQRHPRTLPRNDAPEKQAGRLIATRWVLSLGGARTWCFESFDHAMSRGARVYGEVLGFALTL